MSDHVKETHLNEHILKMKEIIWASNTLNDLIKTDWQLVEFCNAKDLNHLWLIHFIKTLAEDYFIINLEQLAELAEPLPDTLSLSDLIAILETQKIIRSIDGNEYLIAEKATQYSDLMRRYDIGSIEFSLKYSMIDSMTVEEAIEHYKKSNELEPEWATDAFCRYYGWEVPEMIITRA